MSADTAPYLPSEVHVSGKRTTTPNERARRALEDFCAGKPSGPVPRSVWMGEGFIEVFVFNEALHLAGIFVALEARRSGLGTRYLQQLLAAADRHGASVECSIKPFGLKDPATHLGAQGLRAWYRRHRFAPKPGHRGRTYVRTARELATRANDGR